jgi:hypothetical protein
VIKTTCAKINGKDLFFYQCLTEQEAQDAGLPKEVTFYWEYEGRKIINPGEIISMVVSNAKSGNISTGDLITHDALKKHYENVKEAQCKMISDSVGKFREQYAEMKHLPEEHRKMLLKQMDNMQKMFGAGVTPVFPDIDGITRPTIDQAKQLLGTELFDKIYSGNTQEELNKIFPGKK